MLINMLSGITDEAIKKMKGANPEERQRIARITAEFLDLGIQLLRESPEFRSAFARIHTEFLKFPESGETIQQAIIAEKKLGSITEPTGDLGTTH